MATLFRDTVEIGPVGGAAVVFNDPLQLPAVIGVGEWGADIMDGWDDTFDVTAEFIDRGAVDGAVSSEFFPARARSMIVGGYVTAATRAVAHQLWDIIVRDAFPRNKEILIVRHEPIPKQMTVKIAGKRDIEWTGPLAFRWGVPVVAEDPFKYALAPDVGSAGVAGQSTGGRVYPRKYPLHYDTVLSGTANSVIIVNEGTGDAQRFTVTITGPLTLGGWRLANETNDSYIRFDVGLLSTDTLEIDFNRGVALLNGYPVTASITGDFFTLQAGVNVLKLYGDYDPAAGFTVVAYSAWE
jgi:hypothetical protein